MNASKKSLKGFHPLILSVFFCFFAHSAEKYEFKIPIEMTTTEPAQTQDDDAWRLFFISSIDKFKERKSSRSRLEVANLGDKDKWAQGRWWVFASNLGLLNSEFPSSTIGVKKIGNLYLYGNLIDNLDFLGGVEEMTNEVAFENNKITSIKGLSSLKKIKEKLYLNNNKITSLYGLQNLKTIRSLYIHNNPLLVDISAISNLEDYGTIYMDDPIRYRLKPKKGSVFCNSIAQKKIRAKVRVESGSTYKDGPDLSVYDVCSM